MFLKYPIIEELWFSIAILHMRATRKHFNDGEKRGNICYLPGGRSVCEKTVPEVLSTGRRPSAVLKTKGTVFSHTDRPSPVNNISIFFLQ